MRAITGYGGPAKRPDFVRPVSHSHNPQLDEVMPWPAEYFEEAIPRGCSPLAHVNEILDAGRKRRATVLKPHA